ncbi:MAG: serine/threonine protein kinase [Blastocatellia bacterium]|nr:serine/threonine protein kinase [Blastocatellia bacterium]
MLTADTVLQNRYVVLHPLGRGGMGAVYLAKDQRFGSTVVLKETLLTADQYRQAFAREAQLLNHLRHAALPVVMDYFTEGEGQFLVMQYIPGKDLGEQLSERDLHGQGAFPVTQVLHWAEQLLDVLDYLHSHQPPIIHRDIKPQNLKLTPRDEIILLDFGLAKGAAAEMSQANPSLHGFTPGYAPLEQIDGSGTDARSDLYSLAATLYHLLTGRVPPRATTRAAELLNNNPDPLRPAHELNQQVPAAVAAVLLQTMSQNAARRPASAIEMKRLLQAARRNSALADPEASTKSLDQPRTLEFDLPPTEGVGFVSPPLASPSPLSNPEPILQTTQADTLLVRPAIATTPPAMLPVQPPHARKMWALRLALGIGVLLLGAWFAYRWGKPAPANREPAVTIPVPARVAVLRYYIEVETAPGRSRRSTGEEPIAMGQRFRFHFIAPVRGYLYIVAQGVGNALTTYLTAQPTPGSCVTTNLLGAEADYAFPPAGCDGLSLGPRGETTTFTVLFSPTPLTTPSFFAAQAERKLTAAEVQEFEAFRQQAGAEDARRETATTENRVGMTVTMPAQQNAKGVIAFDLPIKRQP